MLDAERGQYSEPKHILGHCHTSFDAFSLLKGNASKIGAALFGGSVSAMTRQVGRFRQAAEIYFGGSRLSLGQTLSTPFCGSIMGRVPVEWKDSNAPPFS
jgi:hypothetical protein